MAEVTVILVGLMIVVPLFIGAILAIILIAGRARPEAGLGPVHSGTAAPTGRWNAQILADSAFGKLGGSAGALTGHLEISDAHLRFFHEGVPGTAPTWSIPCTQIAARAQGAFASAGVVLLSPHGRLRCNVSREHINAWTQNSLKSMREPRYYREFVEVLVAHGASRL